MSAVDWGTVIAAGITGFVGVAGIGGTLVSARMTSKSDAENLRASISAEDRRARVAEKRRIYANCLAALLAESQARTVNAAHEKAPVEARAEGTLQKVMAAREAAMNAVSEVRLIASTEVNVQVTRCSTATSSRSPEWAASYSRLITAMRADLDEPPES